MISFISKNLKTTILTVSLLFTAAVSVLPTSHADVVTPGEPDGEIIPIHVRCSLPTECHRLTQKDFLSYYILLLKQGTRYQDVHNLDKTAPASGYYIGTSLTDKFFPMREVGDSADGYYYLCAPGKNVQVYASNSIGNSGTDDTKFCPEFWAPKLRDTGVVEQTPIGGGYGPPLGNPYWDNSGYGYGGGYGGGGGWDTGGGGGWWSGGGGGGGGCNYCNNPQPPCPNPPDTPPSPVPVPGLMPWTWPWAEMF